MSAGKTLQHDSHRHWLTETDETDIQDFICNGCQMPGSGKRYRCRPCDYDMHERCATCPPVLTSFFMHPHHNLTLLNKPPKMGHVCDICKEPTERMLYRCGTCDFDVHPLCSQLPQHVRHVMHPAHVLELSQSSPSTCVVCTDTCKSWRYRCGICAVDIHIWCMLAPAVGHNNNNNQRARRSKRRIFYTVVHTLASNVAANMIVEILKAL